MLNRKIFIQRIKYYGLKGVENYVDISKCWAALNTVTVPRAAFKCTFQLSCHCNCRPPSLYLSETGWIRTFSFYLEFS